MHVHFSGLWRLKFSSGGANPGDNPQPPAPLGPHRAPHQHAVLGAQCSGLGHTRARLGGASLPVRGLTSSRPYYTSARSGSGQDSQRKRVLRFPPNSCAGCGAGSNRGRVSRGRSLQWWGEHRPSRTCGEHNERTQQLDRCEHLLCSLKRKGELFTPPQQPPNPPSNPSPHVFFPVDGGDGGAEPKESPNKCVKVQRPEGPHAPGFSHFW